MGASTDCSLFLQSDGTVKSCGLNNYGQCGTGDTISPKLNISVISNLENVVQVATGYGHSLFLLSDGTVKSCGRNNHGQCGTGDTVSPKLALSVIPGLTNVASVYAGQYHSGFILKDGSVIIIGMNNYGQCGMGNTTSPKLNLSPIPNLSEVRQLSLDFEHSILLQKDSTVLYCGLNSQGQCGTGDTTSHTALYKIPNLIGVKQIATDLGACFYLMNDGTVKAAGRNDFGQCGNGTLTQVSTLFTIPNLINVKQVFGGLVHTLFLLEDGTVKACGTNANGECGNGVTPSVVKVPTLINNLANVTQISCGHYFSQFLFEDGSVKFCGENQYGQNGTNNIIAQSQPFLISDLIVASLQDLKPINNEIEPVIETKEFNYTGQTQIVDLDPGIYEFYCRGAQGGGDGSYGSTTKARISVLELTTFYINVGQQPLNNLGGWNGGNDTVIGGFGNGGLTDIAVHGLFQTTDWNTELHLNSRLMIAVGGAGKILSVITKTVGGWVSYNGLKPSVTVHTFTASASGTLSFYSYDCTGVPHGYVYDVSTGALLADNWYGKSNEEFIINLPITAGNTYKLVIHSLYSNHTGSGNWTATFPEVQLIPGESNSNLNYIYTEETKDSYPTNPCNAEDYYMTNPVIVNNDPDSIGDGYARISQLKIITNKPKIIGTYDYTGNPQSVVLDNFYSSIMKITNNTQTNAGTYNVTISFINPNYLWEDETSTSVILTWVINKIDPEVTWPTATSILLGIPISNSKLNNGVGDGIFKWVNESIQMQYPNNSFEVIFIPNDLTNYNTLTKFIDIEIATLVFGESITFLHTKTPQVIKLKRGAYELNCSGAQGGGNGTKGSTTKGILPVLKDSDYSAIIGESPLNNIGGWSDGGTTQEPSLYGGGGSTIFSVLDSNKKIIQAAGGDGFYPKVAQVKKIVIVLGGNTASYRYTWCAYNVRFKNSNNETLRFTNLRNNTLNSGQFDEVAITSTNGYVNNGYYYVADSYDASREQCPTTNLYGWRVYQNSASSTDTLVFTNPQDISKIEFNISPLTMYRGSHGLCTDCTVYAYDINNNLIKSYIISPRRNDIANEILTLQTPELQASTVGSNDTSGWKMTTYGNTFGGSISTDGLSVYMPGGIYGNIVRSPQGITSGEMYYEVKLVSYYSLVTTMIGFCDENIPTNSYYGSADTVFHYGYNGAIYSQGGISSYSPALKLNDILGAHLNMDTKKLRYSVNGVWYPEIDVSFLNKAYVCQTQGSSYFPFSCVYNFGKTGFTYPNPCIPVENIAIGKGGGVNYFDSIIASPESFNKNNVGNGYLTIKYIGELLYTPAVKESYYNTMIQSPVIENYEEDKIILLSSNQVNAGTYDISMTPKDTYYWETGYNTTAIFKWIINKINPIITWPTATPLIIDWLISKSKLLNGIGAGTFEWTNANLIMTWPNNGYEVTFIPADTINYNILKKNIIIKLISERYNSNFYKDSISQEYFDFTKLL